MKLSLSRRSFSIETKFGSDLKIYTKEVVSQYPNEEGTLHHVYWFETLTGSPAMLTKEELVKLIGWLKDGVEG